MPSSLINEFPAINPFRHPIRWLKWNVLGIWPEKLPVHLPSPPPAQPGRRSIFLRHLDCGSCNGCELVLQALTNPIYDIAGQGVHFVASPAHADVLMMTGALTYNLQEIAQRTLETLPTPRVIAVGECAINGGEFKEAYGVLPLDERPQELTAALIAEIPGCPPTPQKIKEVLMALELKHANDR